MLVSINLTVSLLSACAPRNWPSPTKTTSSLQDVRPSALPVNHIRRRRPPPQPQDDLPHSHRKTFLPHSHSTTSLPHSHRTTSPLPSPRHPRPLLLPHTCMSSALHDVPPFSVHPHAAPARFITPVLSICRLPQCLPCMLSLVPQITTHVLDGCTFRSTH
ncbi:hypothetical protein EDD85DRAFT_845082 [Armillaria nabsnona]|nr:hypothetical protein EDD85DRAFT_845082 [Armillaria nabsnona]